MTIEILIRNSFSLLDRREEKRFSQLLSFLEKLEKMGLSELECSLEWQEYRCIIGNIEQRQFFKGYYLKSSQKMQEKSLEPLKKCLNLQRESANLEIEILFLQIKAISLGERTQRLTKAEKEKFFKKK